MSFSYLFQLVELDESAEMMTLIDIKRRFEEPSRVFPVSEATGIVEGVHDRRIKIDFEDRFHGKYFYEIAPLTTIAGFLGAEITGIQFVGQSEQFDGRLFFLDGGDVRVEMTAAIDGHNDALQMELLAERGHAPAFQKIKATGTSGNRKFEKNETIAFASSDYDERVLVPLLKQALEKKVLKAKTNQNYRGAWLGVVFDDHVQPVIERKSLRFDPICEAVLSRCMQSEWPFTRVFFVGVSGQYVFDSGALVT